MGGGEGEGTLTLRGSSVRHGLSGKDNPTQTEPTAAHTMALTHGASHSRTQSPDGNQGQSGQTRGHTTQGRKEKHLHPRRRLHSCQRLGPSSEWVGSGRKLHKGGVFLP